MKPPEQKLYVVRKYVKAFSIPDALKKEKKQAPDDVWIDERYQTERVVRGFK